MSSLRLDWCSHDAARYACEKWHYSRCVPAGKLVKVGVWEDGDYKGVVLFGRGANNSLGKPYGCKQTEACELVRIALKEHKAPVSKIGAIALRMLVKNSPGLRLVVSFADPEQEHHGGIYQAMNWLYLGMTTPADEYLANGKRMHGRSMRAKYGTHIGKPFITKVAGSSKHRYLYPLDDEMRERITPLAQPYPKRNEVQ